MKSNRRDFFGIGGLAGLGLAGNKLIKAISPVNENSRNINKPHIQKFNMSGYSAPKLYKVRIGMIGVGARGMDAVERLIKIEGVEIKAVCDKRTEAAETAKKISSTTGIEPAVYSGSEDAWKKVCERDDIDLIYTATPWNLHTPIAVYSMEHDKHIATEVPASSTIDECWQLVETSERTKKHCMMLENCCYDFFELLILNMVRQGFFGEIVHCDCSYIHDLNDEILWDRNRHVDLWQLREISKRTGNLYLTHGFGPVCQVMDINCGDKLDFMVSLSSNDFMLANKARLLASTDDYYKPLVVNTYNGNMNTSIIKTHKGRSIMIQYDTTSPRPYTHVFKW